jgi:hypothetical protein
MIRKLFNKYKIPNNYKNTILIGYFSLLLYLITVFFDLIFNLVYGTINGTWIGHFVLKQ